MRPPAGRAPGAPGRAATLGADAQRDDVIVQLRMRPRRVPAAKAGDTPARALVVRDASKTYGVVRALRSASLELAAGEIHALVGENGSGKSTFVGIVSGTVRPDSGIVAIGGDTMARHTPWESQRHGALTVFQDGSVLPE